MTPSLARRFIEWFVSGLGLGTGLAVGAVIYMWAIFLLMPGPGDHMRKVQEEMKVQQARQSPVQNLPTDLTLTNVTPLAILKNAAVVATIKNDSEEKTYLHVEAELTLLDDTGVLYRCPARMRIGKPLAPGESQEVNFTCHDVERPALPTGVKYELKLLQAYAKPDLK